MFGGGGNRQKEQVEVHAQVRFQGCIRRTRAA